MPVVVSFYGESYVQFNIAESSSSTTSLQLRFRTSRPDGLLFLAAGKESYIFVELDSGNVQVRIDLGAGEQVLRSQWSSHLNDLAWHSVKVLHESNNVTLIIDNHHQTSTRMPGVLVELNIQHGLYVGGSRGLDVPYLDGAQTNFRGCIDDVVFNQHDILASLRSSPRFKHVHEVSLSCSDEFFAGEDEPISFFSSKSYVSFPLWNVQKEGILECTVQTTAEQGLLFYSSGQTGDFVVMEIENGLIKAHVGMEKSTIQLSSLSPVSDNQWHVVALTFSAEYIELAVEKEIVKKSLPLHSKLPVLRGALYIGGVNDAIRAEVLKLKLASVSGRYAQGGSFQGCLRDLKINSKRKSLQDVLVTKDISVGCKIESAVNRNPIAAPIKRPAATAVSISALGPIVSKPYGEGSHDHFLVVNNLIVPEGGQAALESKHIKVNVEFKRLGIRQSQILFKIKDQPSHGYLRLDLEPDQEESTFTMLDLWQGRVLYVHDGSEESYDYFTFSISTSSKREVPPYLQGKKEYMFTITVRPINDAPELTLPNGNVFVLLEHTKKLLSMDSVNISDSDTSSADLSIMVFGNLNADAGFLENSKAPGKAITAFSYEDLKNGNVFFIHTGVKNSRIVLRASDGEKVSNTVVLRIVAVPLEYKLVNNTGVDVLQGDAALITLSHLAIETNAFQQEVEIRYEITEPPQYGEIQRRHGGEWKQTSSFSQRSVERGRVRYACTSKEMQQDNTLEHFKFKVSIGSKISEEFLFPIMVKWLRYNLLGHLSLVIDKENKEYLSPSNLLAVITGLEVPENEIQYKLQSLPEKGNVLLNKVPLQINSTFSQQNISDGKVEYELISRPHEETQDSFRFLISTKYVESDMYDFKISIKMDPRSILLTNNGLTVTEGEGKVITKSELFAQTLYNKAFQYKVTKSPRHGKLTLINFSDSLESNYNLSSFTNQDIIGKQLMYIHDDSETLSDDIHITATAVESSSDTEAGPPLSAEITFNISIQLENDEKPVRVVDKIFHVVKNGKKMLTLADLCYHDPDTDFDDHQLLYTRRGIPNGDLVLVNDTSHRLYQFKQEDLAQKRVLFIHYGANYGRFVLFITDGKHYTSSLLEVSASDPYVHLANNSGLLIQKGREGMITTANLSASTNQDIRSDHEIVFEIFSLPKYGQVFVNNLALSTFTQHDLKMGHVVYRHDDSNNLVDTFSFRVDAKGVQLDAGMNIRMYLESHQRPPTIVQNSSLLVEEGKPVKISKGKLLVVHENSAPSEIEFKVMTPPVYGYLRKFTSEEGYLGAEANPVLTFTQQDINDGSIQYVQTISNQLRDQFSMDVTNGIQAVSGIVIAVDIMPKVIPLEVQNFTVAEGGSKALEEHFLNIPNSHFAGLNCEYDLVEPPKHGRIVNSYFPGMGIIKFTRKQVEQGLIFYIHDDSEQLLDNFTIIAKSTELWKQSLPEVVFVTITPVNDEAPVIKRNKILRVWVGSVTEITTNELCAEDRDSTPAELLYSVSPPNNGHLALKSSPNKSILNFTQAHIEEGQLVFVHSGAMSGGFNFQVMDGLNFAPRQIFSITAQALSIHLENNNRLGVFPGSRKPLTSNNLKAITNDAIEAENRTIVFTVAKPPKLGRLISVLSGNSTQDISRFTQSMVNDGMVLYEHTNKEAIGWNTQDYFTFTVSSPPAALGPQVFHINISYDIKGHDQSSRLLANTGAVVQEGAKVSIDKTNLDASNLLLKFPEAQRPAYEVWYQVTSLPQHGRIVVGERSITREKPNFSQYIIDKFGITYIHDGSESLADQFAFAVWLNQKGKSATKSVSDVLEEKFNITIVPVNDQAPELKTKVLHLNVLQGDTAVLGPENLKVEDADNTPEEIKYTILSSPQNGYITLRSLLNESIKDFTQADVDNGRVLFVQDGSTSSGVFYFSVTDGTHRPLYKLFNLEVTPASVTLVNLTEVVLLQGQNTVAITNMQLSATTNRKNTEISFEVTEPLRNGHLLVSNKEVMKFQQADLYAGRLLYRMTDLTTSRDRLEFAVITRDHNLTGQVLNITIQPLVQMAPVLNIPNWMAYRLKTSDLDATQLANLTNSNPRFEVIVPPAYGRVVRRSLANTKSEGLSVFTQGDIDRGVIFLEVNASMTGVDVLNDSFTFRLRADNVQPATGHFYYGIVPQSPLLVQALTSEVQTSAHLLTIASILKSYTMTTNEPPLLPKDEAHTQAPGQTAQTWWRNRNRWGHQDDNDVLFAEEVARGRSIWAKTTMKTSSTSTSVQPQDNSSRLLIIVPLASVAIVFTVAAVAFCIFLLCHKRTKAKLLIADQPLTVPSSPVFCPERSLTVPTVTVTPIIKVTGNTAAVPFVAIRQEQFHPVPPAPAPAPKGLQQSPWSKLDPGMIQHGCKTNPALKCNQYWV
ncbi:chondroitin sulfate proteoglycan 4-like isoform X2 [Hemicordylus capensis]|uniref:chondroitin sulfate proteoglycan 4-like isoform X2 n=1 Tax=Hemicordylus capensis TaxID=884348 RepID=UPI002303A53A|nr:chondroitin sulfate proteoglycan 4-like isoform X2 [Hemicordylus capensis]